MQKRHKFVRAIRGIMKLISIIIKLKAYKKHYEIA